MTDWATLGMSGILDQNVPQSVRQKIALAMLLKKRAAPTTFGAGLASIGDSLSDAFMARGIYSNAAEAERAGIAAEDRIAPPPTTSTVSPAVRRSYATEDVDPPIVPATPPALQAVTPALLPARPLPADERQSEEPGAPHRLPSTAAVQDWRNSTPRPNIPPVPQQPPQPPQPAPLTQPLTPPPQPQVPPPAQPTPFQNRFTGGPQAAVQPPPGTPVMAAGDEPSAQERDQGRNMLAQAMQQQQAARGGQPPIVPPQPQEQPPPQAAAPPQPQPITPAPLQPQVRPLPPPQPQAQQGPGPGYVLTLPPEEKPPPTMTPGMQAIRDEIRRTPPAYQDSVKQRLQPYYEQEKAKLDQLNVIYQDKMKSRHELIKLQEEQKRQADADIRAARKSTQETITPIEGGAVDPRLLGTPQSPQRTGPRIEPVPPGDIPERWVKQEAEKIGKAKDSYEKAKPELTETVDIINKIRAHPAKPYATGMFSGITAATPQGKGFVALNEQLMGKNLVDAYQKLQGTGQIGEKEGANFAKARARLTTATTEADYDEALKDLETTVRGTLERAQRNLKMPVTAWQNTQNDDYAPDIGQVKKGHEYLGGNPADPRNWKAVRR